MVRPRKSHAMHPGVRVKKNRWLTVFERSRKKKKAPVQVVLQGPVAQA